MDFAWYFWSSRSIFLLSAPAFLLHSRFIFPLIPRLLSIVMLIALLPPYTIISFLPSPIPFSKSTEEIGGLANFPQD